MAKVPYIPLYIGDWEQDTNSLSLQAEAAWLKIIFKMFKDNKSGIYKTSTNALQNLWKIDTKGVQNILDELIENNICGIAIDDKVVFSNRRMIKEREIGEKRTKAVQNRYKPSTKPLQNTEYENEYDIDNVVIPIAAEKIENEISDFDVGKTIEFVKITANTLLTNEQVKTYYKAFLIHAEDELHLSKGDHKQHFRNWLKKQDFKNGTTKNNSTGNAGNNGKQSATAGRGDALDKW